MQPRFAAFLLALALLAAPAPAPAQGLEAITERAERLRELQAILASDDPFMQLAAYEHAIASEDPLVVKMAIDAGLDSTSLDLRMRALRDWLRSQERFDVLLALPQGANAAQRQLHEQKTPLYFGIREVGETALALDERGSASLGYRGGYLPGGFAVTWRNCRLELAVVDRATLAGSFGCGAMAPLPATVAMY